MEAISPSRKRPLARLASPTVGRTSPSERFAAAGGVLLLIGLFTKWYTDAGRTRSGWSAVHEIRWLLLLCGLMAVGWVVAKALGRLPELPVAPSLVLAPAGALSTALVLLRWFHHPASHLSVRIGLFVALVGAIIVAVGAWQALAEEHHTTRFLEALSRLGPDRRLGP